MLGFGFLDGESEQILLLASGGVVLLLLLLLALRFLRRRALPAPSGADTTDASAPSQKPAASPETAPVPAGPTRRSLYAQGLQRTRSGFVARLSDLVAGKQIDESLLGQIEEVLLTADVGVKTATRLLDSVRSQLSRSELKDADLVWKTLREESQKILEGPGAVPLNLAAAKPLVVLVIGVNGVGKTTTIGKLASKWTAEGKRVLLAAGDTFRAAATEQLDIWASRVHVPIVKGKEGADPASVIHDATRRAVAEGFDILIADTAGRLHTKSELMEELKKVRKVIGKAMPGAPHETILVLDSTNGQNAIQQATLFKQMLEITGIVLTKLDGTAKGGVILGICDELQVPVRFIGVGEKVEDLHDFDAADFVAALFGT